MNAPAQERPALSISDHPDHSPTTTTEERRIRVTDCPGGWDKIPNALRTLAFKKLQGSRNTIFWYVWDKTVRHNKPNNRDHIPMVQFTNALPDSISTIQRTIDWLRDNDWLVVNEEPGKMTEYGIPDWIVSFCSPKEEEQKEELEESDPGQNDRTNPGQNDRLHKKGIHKKENPLTPKTVNITGNSQKHARGKGRVIASLEDEEIIEIAEQYSELYDLNTVRSGLMKMKFCGVAKDLNWAMSYNFDEVFVIVDKIFKRFRSSEGKGMHSPGGFMVSEIQKSCTEAESR